MANNPSHVGNHEKSLEAENGIMVSGELVTVYQNVLGCLGSGLIAWLQQGRWLRGDGRASVIADCDRSGGLDPLF